MHRSGGEECRLTSPTFSRQPDRFELALLGTGAGIGDERVPATLTSFDLSECNCQLSPGKPASTIYTRRGGVKRGDLGDAIPP